ncbi:MAG: hypothetical protein GY754_38245 [bacterium]|nr:hypothetical protein [bacterium]
MKLKFKKKNAATLFNTAGLLAVLLTILALFACEDNAFDPDDGSPGNGGGNSGSIEIVSTAAELPTCGAEQKGEMYYVQDSGELSLCDGSEYKVMNAAQEPNNPDANFKMLYIGRDGDSTINYHSPDGTKHTLTLGDGLSKLGGSSSFSDYSPHEYIAYEPGSDTNDAALYFNIEGTTGRCTLFHAEDENPSKGFYFSADSGNEFADVWGTTAPNYTKTFAIKRDGMPQFVFDKCAEYYIFCQ